MGCLAGRDSQADVETVPASSMSPEDKKMIENEKKLPFSSMSSKEIIRSLKAEVSDNTVSLPQLKRALHELKISPECVSNPDDPFYILLKQFKTPKKLYDLKEMSVLAILIGKGVPQEKADWLFKQYDEDASGMLSAAEIAGMMNDIITVACEKLPEISIGDAPNLLSDQQVKAYLGPIMASKDAIIVKVQKQLLTEAEISQHEFTLKMCDPQQSCNQLLWSVGVRILCKSLL